jgi:hypothetical protein
LEAGKQKKQPATQDPTPKWFKLRAMLLHGQKESETRYFCLARSRPIKSGQKNYSSFITNQNSSLSVLWFRTNFLCISSGNSHMGIRSENLKLEEMKFQ